MHSCNAAKCCYQWESVSRGEMSWKSSKILAMSDVLTLQLCFPLCWLEFRYTLLGFVGLCLVSYAVIGSTTDGSKVKYELHWNLYVFHGILGDNLQCRGSIRISIFSMRERERERERLIFPIFQLHSGWVLGNEVCLFIHGILLHPNFSSKFARLTLKSWSIQPSQFSKFEQYSQHSKSACEHLLC
jgi:hypothetical protein